MWSRHSWLNGRFSLTGGGGRPHNCGLERGVGDCDMVPHPAPEAPAAYAASRTLTALRTDFDPRPRRPCGYDLMMRDAGARAPGTSRVKEERP
jgi:hypothetical protein